LDIDKLYKATCTGGKSAENKLFSHLSEIFQLFLRLRVQDENDRQDIVQDTLMEIANNYRNANFNVGFSEWAYGILKHKLADYYRIKQTRELRFIQANCTDNLIDEIQVNKGLERMIRKCLRKIHKMNPKYIRILNLRYLGFGIDEMCEKLNTTPNYIYVNLFRARHSLKKCLQEGDVLDE
jgi:RNA polymerase sigma factor (sigma-70 family)